MSEAQSISDIFYPTENTEANTESTGSTVETDVVDGDKTPIVETVEAETAVDTDSGDDDTGGDDATLEDGADDETLYYEINGEQFSEADVKEWKDGGLRQADYTQKTQDLAGERKKVEAQASELAETRTKLDETIAGLEAAFKADEDGIDWDYLREHDTAEYIRQTEVRKEQQTLLEKAKTDAQALKDNDRAAMIESERAKLFEIFPEWKDPATGAEAIKDAEKLINGYAEANGFTNDEFAQLSSASLMTAIHKAARFDALQEKNKEAEKVVRKAPKIQKPSKKAAPTQAKSTTELFYGTK